MSSPRYALAFLAVAALAAPGFSQVTTHAKHHAKPTAAARRAAALRAAADSVAAARADSLRRALAQAEADSARSADSIAAAKEAEAHRPLRVIPNTAFGLGERLVFDVNYGFITAGEATLQVAGADTIAGRLCYRIEFRVNSLPSFSWIYRVEDRYVTFIDEETIAPWRFEQHVREGSYSRDFTASFDQRKNIATTSEGTYPIPPYVHDILSAFYYARTLDYGPMKPGDQVELHNFYKDKTYDLAVRFLGRQDLDVAAGTFHTVVIEPLVKEGGLIKSEGRIVIWLTDDERKIPVRVNTKVVIGSIDTELREYAGVRGPVTSRVK
ncbi:MAG TPA: DUF3108 domain-containing protein [Bacteroidota bacterium]|nr:DUF3108 domain-containing protein [Bacteroidota bacterium]